MREEHTYFSLSAAGFVWGTGHWDLPPCPGPDDPVHRPETPSSSFKCTNQRKVLVNGKVLDRCGSLFLLTVGVGSPDR